jgi:hypothetical protein
LPGTTGGAAGAIQGGRAEVPVGKPPFAIKGELKAGL